MKNITIKVDEEVARWARAWAAEHGTSVSRMLGEKLTEMMQADRRYQAAQRRFLARQLTPLRSSADERFPDRDTLHDR
jgi:S-adenosylmethionine:diacylglycerol 3-amino-3-carboxypropyl transferase